MNRLWNALDRFLIRLGKANGGLALILIAILGWLDYATGFEISFSFFYLLPISIVSWYMGLGWAYSITALGVLTWLVSNWLAGDTYSSEWIRFFNMAVRLVVFSSIANLLHKLKTAIQLEHQFARTDYLTGVFNRREFVEQLGLELKRANRIRYPLSLAYIDLDNFKHVNDEQGHSAGDQHLRLIANTITSVIRETDLFARLGGDEFVLLLPNTDRKNAEGALQKIEKAVKSMLEAINSSVTLSIGVVTFLTPPSNVDDMLHPADALMYQAKSEGKDRIQYIVID